jgi:hypothetical protein
METPHSIESRGHNESRLNQHGWWARLFLWGLMLAPAILLMESLSLGLHVRIGLGRWPEPMIDNYSHPLFQLHSLSVVMWGAFAAYAALPLWVLAWCFRPFRKDALHPIQFVVFVLGWGAVIGYCRWDPQRFGAWFMD